MAIYIPGIRCSLCGRVIPAGDDAVMFPPFVSNQADPLYVFNDGVFHVACFGGHALAEAAQARYEEHRERTKPGNRSCFVCGEQITNPDDYLAFGHLVDTPKHPLHSLNYSQFHRSCLGSWSALSDAIRNLEALDQSGTWKGNALKRLIKELLRYTPPPAN